MPSGGKVIDFYEAAERVIKKKKMVQPASESRAITRVERVRAVTMQEIEKALSDHPELECLHEKGVTPQHIAAWLQMFPSMSLNELVAILQLAVRKLKSGENERIIDYLFQPFSTDQE